MNTAIDLINYLNGKKYDFKNFNTNKPYLNINGHKIIFDILNNKYSIDGLVPGHERIIDLTKPENHSVVMILIKLFEKGYSADVITLEKQWQLGHNDSGSLDVMIKNPENNDIYMIEVKSSQEINSYVNLKNEKKLKQVFSYAIQEKTTKIISFYAYDFDQNKDLFFNVYTENILKEAQNVDDFFERWNKVFDKSDYILRNNIFNVTQSVKKYEDLEKITNNDTKNLFDQFATILRLHSISDKPNAFIKMINLFLAKIGDEVTANKNYKVKDKDGNLHDFSGIKFQFIYGVDTAESFMKRLNELYKDGMHEYLKKDVIDYNDDEIEQFIKGDDEYKLLEIFDNLRLKKNNNFAFIDVYDDDTFYQNYEVVKSVVELLENYKFKYETKHQFLGDFFEELLNTSLKQEAGQFFTPYPLVDFMINSLPYEQYMYQCISQGKQNIIPSVIDYACGAGHFLISSMARTQEIINELSLNEEQLTPAQKNKISAYTSDPYSWVNKENCVGIEKDYRLAKTTKIATFLNGDGDAEIISGDGINKFSSKDYENTILYTNNKKLEKFDFLISNPPYSIDGFMRNFIKNGITPDTNDFSLLEKINYNDSAIETFFVERAEQLIKKDGFVAIVLPQSILSNSKYGNMRSFIFNNFVIKGMLMTSDITFSGTTTSPVMLFLKKEKRLNKHYQVCIVGSPKYLTPTNSKMKLKEVNFLGYEFSTNRSKTGITIHEKSLLKEISPIMKKFIEDGSSIVPENLKENVEFKYLDEILLNIKENYVGDIYPKYYKNEGVPLKKYCKINCRKETDFENFPSKYAEIGDLKNLSASSKKKTSTRLCKEGDILVASLCPRKTSIVIANGDYMLSSAIHVLSNFKNDEERDFIYKQLRTDEVLKQMNTMLDGFKVTYAKISEENLITNVLIPNV
jgi:type I restriction enzyme M protein